ncbi:MAG: hypothetical protein SFT92_00650 [Rickettsiales bacterium]|nr:hypothetical protein [Rickettsiales bacterium]
MRKAQAYGIVQAPLVEPVVALRLHDVAKKVSDTNTDIEQANALAKASHLEEAVPLVTDNPESPMANLSDIMAKTEAGSRDAAALEAKVMQKTMLEPLEDGSVLTMLSSALAAVGGIFKEHGVCSGGSVHERDLCQPLVTSGLWAARLPQTQGMQVVA